MVLYIHAKIARELPAEWGLDRELLRAAARRGYRQRTGVLLPILLSAALLERAVQRGNITQARRIWRRSHRGARNTLAMANVECTNGSADRARELLTSLAESTDLTDSLCSKLNEQDRRFEGATDAVEAAISQDEPASFMQASEQEVNVANRVQRLSHTERGVLIEVASRTVSEVARQRFVSRNTVKSQLRSAYRKLGVNTKDEALRVVQLADPRYR
ncbi:MAG: LuxR C-terminal-related transcriptional regulator [Cumulibacter sp.]